MIVLQVLLLKIFFNCNQTHEKLYCLSLLFLHCWPSQWRDDHCRKRCLMSVDRVFVASTVTMNLSLVIERELSILNLSQHVRTCSSAKVIALYLCEYFTWSHNNRILFHKKMSCSSSPQRSRIHSYSSVTTYDCFIVFSWNLPVPFYICCPHRPQPQSWMEKHSLVMAGSFQDTVICPEEIKNTE